MPFYSTKYLIATLLLAYIISFSSCTGCGESEIFFAPESELPITNTASLQDEWANTHWLWQSEAGDSVMLYHFLDNEKVHFSAGADTENIKPISSLSYRAEFVIEEKNTVIYFLDGDGKIVKQALINGERSFAVNDKTFKKR